MNVTCVSAAADYQLLTPYLRLVEKVSGGRNADRPLEHVCPSAPVAFGPGAEKALLDEDGCVKDLKVAPLNEARQPAVANTVKVIPVQRRQVEDDSHHDCRATATAEAA